jgi:hypothetical protein
VKETFCGLVIYSFETGRYTKLHNDLRSPAWLSDNHRVLAIKNSTDPVVFSIFDIVSGKDHEIFSAKTLGITPDFVLRQPVISPDDQTIYIGRGRVDSDIWMLTINSQ